MAKNYIPELLAPAGSIDALKAAVNAGADAVYISGKKFGARKFATNFTDLEIEEGLEYAKLRSAKIYVTVNTLVKNSKLQSVAEYLLWLYEIGVDAVIIQDLGVASLANKIVPDMDMHASTQMTIHNISGVKWASKFGFKRVVLSRELGISEVKEIIKKTRDLGVEIEIFGHGALCYSYSGQCLLSSFIGGRSGNKGMCAQPCRKKYTLLSGKIDKYGKPLALHSIDITDKYLLSTRDLATYQNLDRISGTRINSLKIEGRMRSAEYVAIVVNIYRKALDLISLNKWKPDFNDISKLKLAFNRKFTGGYLTEHSAELVMARDSPGNRGLYIGQVQKYDSKTRTVQVKIKNKYKLEIGDGIVFKYSHNKLEKKSKQNEDFKTYGMAIEKSPKYKTDKIILKVGRPVKPGSKLYLTRSISLNHDAMKIIKDRPHPSISIDIVMWWDYDLNSHLEGKFIGFHGNECKVHLKSSFKMEKAINKPLSTEQIENQLQKTGKTPFTLRKVSIKYPGDLFAPISKLNNFRREFLEKSQIKLLLSYKPPQYKIQKAYKQFDDTKMMLSPHMEQFESKNSDNTKICLAVYADSLNTVKGALESGVNRIYFEVPIKNSQEIFCSSSHDHESFYDSSSYADEIERVLSILIIACELCKKTRTEFIWKWPQITHQHQINQYYTIINRLSEDFHGIMIDNLGVANEIKRIAPNIEIYGSPGLNIWNKQTVLQLVNIFDTITPSAELSKEDLNDIISSSKLENLKTNFELVVQGNVDTLVTKDCLLSLVPEKDIKNINNEFWGIQDEKKQIFPIKIDLNGRTHILNSVELCLIDHLNEIAQIGINSIVVDLRTKTYHYAKDMTSIYKSGLEYIKKEEYTGKNMNKLKSKIKIISTGGITTGNFLKGVKE